MSQVTLHARFWDGSEPGWVLLQHSEDHYVVSVGFGDDGAQVKDVQALRAVSAEWAEQSPAQALSNLKGKRDVVLGSFESSVARKLVVHCESLQLSVVATPRKITQHSFFNELTERFAIIEDEELADNLTKEALAHGISIRRSTV